MNSNLIVQDTDQVISYYRKQFCERIEKGGWRHLGQEQPQGGIELKRRVSLLTAFRKLFDHLGYTQ